MAERVLQSAGAAAKLDGLMDHAHPAAGITAKKPERQVVLSPRKGKPAAEDDAPDRDPVTAIARTGIGDRVSDLGGERRCGSLISVDREDPCTIGHGKRCVSLAGEIV